MKKGILKRCVAFALALVMVFTVADLSGMGTAKAAGNKLTIDEAQIIADNYAEYLTDEEVAILESGMLGSVKHEVATPTGSDLTAVDSESKVVYAKAYTDGDYTWKPEAAVVVSGETEYGKITLGAFDAANVADDYKAYDVSGSFASLFAEGEPEEYQVEVTYNLYIDIAEGEQQRLLNLPYYIADGMEAMAAVEEASMDMDTLVMAAELVKDAINEMHLEEAKDLIDAGLIKPEQIKMNPELEAILDKWIAENETYDGLSKLTATLTDGGYFDDDSTIQNVFENGTTYKVEAEAAHADVTTVLGLLDQLVDAGYSFSGNARTFYRTVDSAKELLDEAMACTWGLLDETLEPVLDKEAVKSEGYADFEDETVADAIGNCAIHVFEVTEDVDTDIEVTIDATTFLAASSVVQSNVNSHYVTVVVEAIVYDGDKEKTLTDSTKILMLEGSTPAEIEAEVAATGLENEAVAEWAAYDVNTTNYTRTTTKLSGGLAEEIDYVITYTPNDMTITYKYAPAADEPTKVPYGKTIILPEATEEGVEYEYTVVSDQNPTEMSFVQGTEYRVISNLTIDREKMRASEDLRVNDIVVTDYANELTSNEETILKNAAVVTDNISIRMIKESDVSLNGTTLYAPVYTASIDGMVWQPTAIIETPEGTIEKQFVDNKVDLEGIDVSSIVVEYKLQVAVNGTMVSNDYVMEKLNLPYTLVTEADSQLLVMDKLVTYKSYLDKLKKGVLSGMIDEEDGDPRLSADSKAAIQVIIDNCYDSTGLYLSSFATKIEGMTSDSDKLAYYYGYFDDNKTAETDELIRSQIKLMAEQLEIMLQDDGFKEVFIEMADEATYNKVADMKDDLADMVEKMPAKNDDIIVSDDAAYSALLAALVSAKDTTGAVKEHDASVANWLYCEEAFTFAGAGSSTVKVVLTVLEADGDVVSTTSKSVTGTKTGGLTQAKVDELNTFINDFAADINEDYYTSVVAGSIPVAGTALENDVTITYSWTMKDYTIKCDGNADVVINDANRSITLERPTADGIQYVYDIAGKEVTVDYAAGSSTYTYTLTDIEFASVVAATDKDGSLVITKEEKDTRVETVKELIADLNEAGNAAVNIVPLEDAAGNMSVVLRVNPFDTSAMDALTSIMTELQGQEFVALGGEAFVSDSIYLDTVIDLVLNSGIGTDSLIGMIDANGNIDESTMKAKTKGTTVMTDLAQGVPATGALGGLLVETTISCTKDGSLVLPFYITLQDYDKNAAELSNARTALEKAKPYATFELSEGKVNVDMNAPDKVHEAYMAAMLIQGETSIDGIKTPTLDDMVTYVESVVDAEDGSIIDDTNVTASTLLNTVGQVSSADLAAYEDAIDTVLKVARWFVDEDMTNGDIVSTVTANTPDDTYSADVKYPLSELISKAGFSTALAGAFTVRDADKNIVIPVEATLADCNTEYAAAVLDVNAEETLDKAYFVKENKLGNIKIEKDNDNVVVVLLADVDTIKANGTTYIDLNGYTLDKLVANGDVSVFDSRLATAEAGTINNIYGNGNINITAGRYEDDVTKYLPSGYVQEGGVVSNGLYTICVVDDEIVIELADDVLATATEDSPAWKAIAAEVAVDVLLNVYTWGSVTVDGETIYETEFLDLVAQYKSGMNAIATNAVEIIDETALTNFANTLIADLTDFTAIADAIDADEAVASYDLVTKPWKVTATVEGTGEDNYLAANLVTGDEVTRKLTVKVVCEEGEESELAALFRELGEIVTIDASVELTDLHYDASSSYYMSITAEGSGDVVVDVTASEYAEDYLVVIGTIMAYGMEDGNAKNNMVSAVKAYLDEVTEETQDALIAEIEALTSAQIITSLKAATGKDFAAMASSLGIEGAADATSLEAIYHNALTAGYILVGKSDVTGGSRTVGSFATEDYATYYADKTWKTVDGTVKVILAKEVEAEPVVPEIIAPVKPQYGDLIKGFAYDADAKEIYIDVAWDGIKDAQFESLIRFETKDAERYELAFNKAAASDYVCTGNTVTVTAYNGTKTDVETYTIIVVGDVNKDGWSTASDAGIIGKYAVGTMSIEGAAAKAANINRSTEYVITVSDAKLIQDKFLFQETYTSLFK